MEDKKMRISFGFALGILMLAAFFDLVGLIPFAEDFIIWIYWGIATYLLSKRGVSMFDGKKLATMAVDVVIAVIPALQMLPEIFIGTAAILFLVYFEDKTGLKMIDAKGQTVSKIPLNNGKIRLPRPDLEAHNGEEEGAEAANITEVDFADGDPEELEEAA